MSLYPNQTGQVHVTGILLPPVVALGRPVENDVLEDAGGSIRYYRDDEGVHHMPKRGLGELVVEQDRIY